MSDQPTKAEVEDLRAAIIPFGASGLYSDRFACIVRLCDAYLAQGEEVERLRALLAQERHDHNLEVAAYQEQLMNVTLGGMAQLKAREIEIEALKSSSYRADKQDGE